MATCDEVAAGWGLQGAESAAEGGPSQYVRILR
jgi:hypothetical protein